MAAVPVALEVTVFRSKLPGIEIPSNLPRHEYCFARVAELADASCVIRRPQGTTHTYAETRLLCRKTAVSLRGLGVGQGDHI